tara:strand:+ start:150 stop:470 length:321 start_codon:yes stop_codon:yes gene_type:complete
LLTIKEKKNETIFEKLNKLPIDEKKIKSLEIELEKLNKKRFFKIYDSFWNLIIFNLIKGLVSGLGWVIGATILVSVFTFILSKFEFIPIIGELISKIIIEMRTFER